MSIGVSGRVNNGSGAAPPANTGTSSTKPSGRGKAASDEALLVIDSQRAVGTAAHRLRERALTSLRLSGLSAACALPRRAGGAANGSTAYLDDRRRATGRPASVRRGRVALLRPPRRVLTPRHE